MSIYVCVPRGCLVPRGQKKVSESLELKFQMVVSHHVGTGDCTQVLFKSSGCSQSLSYFSRSNIFLSEYPTTCRTQQRMWLCPRGTVKYVLYITISNLIIHYQSKLKYLSGHGGEHLGGRNRWITEFGAILFYPASSRTA